MTEFRPGFAGVYVHGSGYLCDENDESTVLIWRDRSTIGEALARFPAGEAHVGGFGDLSSLNEWSHGKAKRVRFENGEVVDIPPSPKEPTAIRPGPMQLFQRGNELFIAVQLKPDGTRVQYDVPPDAVPFGVPDGGWIVVDSDNGHCVWMVCAPPRAQFGCAVSEAEAVSQILNIDSTSVPVVYRCRNSIGHYGWTPDRTMCGVDVR